MKRRGLIALLFGGAAAGQTLGPKRKDGSACKADDVWFMDNTCGPMPKYKPKNGECPQCGEMAMKYKYVEGPTDRPQIIRCAHCNNAFWQDAEK